MDSQQFGEHMWNLTTSGFTVVSVIFGNELGLFDIIQNTNKPLTSLEIAVRADIKERYVREWLGGMTAAQIVAVDMNDDRIPTYSLPEGHFHIIMKNASACEALKMCIGRFDITQQFFKPSGPWGCDFDRQDFWNYFDILRDNSCENILCKDILPSLEYSKYLKEGLNIGIKVLDIGCGAWPFTVALAKTFPKSNFVGLDISDKALKLAKKRSSEAGITNVCFLNGDAHILPQVMTDQYDMVMMFDTLHNLSDPYMALGEVKKVLKADGKIMIYDERIHSKHSDNVGNMTASYWYTASTFVCVPCSLSGESKVGYGIGWGEEEMLKSIGSYFTFEKKFEYANLIGLYIYSN